MINRKPLTDEDIRNAFLRAVQTMNGAETRWKERTEKGLTESQLIEALHYELGIGGGCSSYNNRPNVHYKGAGLKIWAIWESISPYTVPPTLQGQQTINMARTVFGIKDPSDKQISLF